VAKRKTAVPFNGTAEQETKLRKIIEEHKDMQGALMPVLQKAQDVYGYLPIEVQKIIAEGLNIPLEEVYGVVTFYAQFSLNPVGKYRISVCMGTACYVKGAQLVLDELCKQLGIKPGDTTPDGLFTLEATRCLGCCGLAPVMMINNEVHGRLVPGDVKKILDKYRD
jgi:NADP-reducing hydrogenase subunit HndA